MSKEEENIIPNWANIDFDEIELGERIGGGGVGIIYKGWWRNKPVALKTLFDARISHDLKKEYMDELIVMSKVDHSNIVKFLGACMTPPNLCFIMELCECSLFDIIHVKKSQSSLIENLRIAIDIACAMEYLHSLSPAIIHRDLKSLNVLKSFDGSFKLCDFGLVRVKHTTAGTPAYMAPELIENKPYNKSVDVYSFGVLLWEILNCEIPFNQLDVNEIRRRIVSGERPRISNFGSFNRLNSIIKRCWDQSSESRPSFTEVVDELLIIERETPESNYTENMKNSVGDALDGLIFSGK